MNEKSSGDVCYQFPQRQLLRLTGRDCKKWFHNFCTADINGLESGQGCEAFVLNVKGKTIAHVIVLASKFDLTLIVMGEPEIPIIKHFETYIITEQVVIEDLGENQSLWYASGSKLNSMFDKHFPGHVPYSHALVRDRSIAVTTNISGKRDWLLIVNKTEEFTKWYGGVNSLDEQKFQKLRIGNRWPFNGSDVTMARLPQEFQRDSQAISFEKGCYLGQETVARIDAIGHVNYFFVSLDVKGLQDIADSGGEGVNSIEGLELKLEDKAVGKVTSACGKKAIGFVRKIYSEKGQQLESDFGQVIVG